MASFAGVSNRVHPHQSEGGLWTPHQSEGGLEMKRPPVAEPRKSLVARKVDPFKASWRGKLGDFIELEGDKSRVQQAYAIFMTFLNILSVVLLMLGTTPLDDDVNLDIWNNVMDIIFTVEFTLRCLGRRSFIHDTITDLSLWIDLCVIAPFYLEQGFPGVDLEFTRTLKILRIIKVGRYFEPTGTDVMVDALKKSIKGLLVPFFFLFATALLLASVMYYLERNSNESFSSIPTSLWFMMVTMTTVGYGDMSPTTAVGQILCVFCMAFGLIFIAMPLSIVGNHFAFAMEHQHQVVLLIAVRKHLGGSDNAHEELLRLFNEVDDDGSGEIGYEEFKRILVHFQIPLEVKEMKKAFDYFDPDGSGSITVEEFFNVVFPNLSVEEHEKIKKRSEVFKNKARKAGTMAVTTQVMAQRCPDCAANSQKLDELMSLVKQNQQLILEMRKLGRTAQQRLPPVTPSKKADS